MSLSMSRAILFRQLDAFPCAKVVSDETLCPIEFKVDIKGLEGKFRTMQMEHHPDKHATKSQEARTRAEETSAALNEAYKTLKHPVARAEHMLRIYGSEIGEDDREVDPELLMEAFETREELQEAKDQSEVDAVVARIEGKVLKSSDDVASAFVQGDIEDARKHTISLKYYHNILDVAGEKRL